MTILFGAVQGVAAIKAEALSIHHAKTPRCHLKSGREYLHWSASKLTSNRAHAWVGTLDQAKACRRTFAAAAGCKITAISDIPQHSEMEA
jgi:hypothetical protein